MKHTIPSAHGEIACPVATEILRIDKYRLRYPYITAAPGWSILVQLAKDELPKECSAAVPPYWDRLTESTSETCHRPLPCPIHSDHDHKFYTEPDCPRCEEGIAHFHMGDTRPYPIGKYTRIAGGYIAERGKEECPTCGADRPDIWKVRAVDTTRCPDPWHPFNRSPRTISPTLESALAEAAINLVMRIHNVRNGIPLEAEFEKALSEVLHDPKWEVSK